MNVINSVYMNGDKEIAFSFKTNLRASEKSKFVNTVTDLLVDGVNYNAVLFDLVFKYILVVFLTDIDTSEIDDAPNTMDRIEDFIENTNIVDVVKANVEAGLIDELRIAAIDNIAYRTGVRHDGLQDALAKLLTTVEQRIRSVDVDALMAAANTLGKIGDLTPEHILDVFGQSDVFKASQKERNDIRASKDNDRIIEQTNMAAQLSAEKADV